MTDRSYNARRSDLISQSDAAQIEPAGVPRSRFIGQWGRKTSIDAGKLYPFMIDEILPGDHMQYNVTAYVRMSTPLFPQFDGQRVDTFFFYVPARLLWSNWNRFMGEQASPSSNIYYNVPQVTPADPSGYLPNGLPDHFGIPTAGQQVNSAPISVNALPFRAYNMIWNTWFRDQNIQDELQVKQDDGPDSETIYGIQYRNKSADYFTSALPWPGKFTNPTVPLGGLVPVVGIGHYAGTSPAAGTAGPVNIYDTLGATSFSSYLNTSVANGISVRMLGTATTDKPAIYADLSQATGVTINTLRDAWLVQALLERDARGGTRYVELIRSHFGVVNPDFRLQRPEYIGGGSTALNITPIAQTAPSTGVPVGALGAAGTAAGQHEASYAATEHGYIIALINVKTELSYQQGLHKMWSRKTRFDFYWPTLASLGEQAVLRQEIYATGVAANDTAIFGYQERWHEYRTRYSEATGMMRSYHSGTLDAWHLAQRFTSAPTLSPTFIQDAPPMSRILAAGTLANNQQYLADIAIRRTATRPLPMYGTPANLGRF